MVDRQLGQVLWKYVRGEGGEGLSASAHIPHPSAQALVHPARPRGGPPGWATTNVVPEPATSQVSHIAAHFAPPTINEHEVKGGAHLDGAVRGGAVAVLLYNTALPQCLHFALH